MVDQLAVLLGGRTAEELVFHEPTTGASNDIEKATAICRAMVTQYGMSERLGALKFGHDNGEVFLGRDMGHQRDYSEEVAAEIDEEVRKLIEAAHDEAWEMLVRYRDVLDDLVLRLMDKETLSKEEVLAVFAPIEKRPSRGLWTGTGKRLPSDRPPVLTPAELALLRPADVADLMPEPGTGTPRFPNGSGNGDHTERPSLGQAGLHSRRAAAPSDAQAPRPGRPQPAGSTGAGQRGVTRSAGPTGTVRGASTRRVPKRPSASC